MLILNERDITGIGMDWKRSIEVIRKAVGCLQENDFSQPLKPYLRYRDRRNRIIAMPAFIGGDINKAGIKWIASFPGNLRKGLPRAHSVVVLNDADTGEPLAVIVTPLLSIIRTASVSGMMIRYFDTARDRRGLTIGISGFGPIGRHHLQMCLSLLAGKIDNVLLYDIREIDPADIEELPNVHIANSWQEAYRDADIFITCTVADAPYIDHRPKPGSLHLNVSLRDYKTVTCEWFSGGIIVDDWEEVCRENTDIELMHREKGLQKADTRSIVDVVRCGGLADYDAQSPILFNPMGMAVFDIAMASYYYEAAKAGVSMTPAF